MTPQASRFRLDNQHCAMSCRSCGSTFVAAFNKVPVCKFCRDQGLAGADELPDPLDLHVFGNYYMASTDELWFTSLDGNQRAHQERHSPHWSLYTCDEGVARWVESGVRDTEAMLQWLAYRRFPLASE